MTYFELDKTDISALSDSDLRELVARLCEAETVRQGSHPSCVTWGGAQEAPDGGLDVNVKDSIPSKTGFVPRANTGFQVKKHGLGKTGCRNEMRHQGSLKPVIAELAAKKGGYIIVSGKDDCSEKMLSDRVAGMKEAASGLSNDNDLLLDFYGRDRLSSWLRQHPGVGLWARARLGKPLSGWKPFGRWAATPNGVDDAFLVDDHPCVIDKNASSKDPSTILQGVALIRDKLRTPGSAVRITGLSGVGKTRLAQALFELPVGEAALPATEVLYADLGDDLTPTASELTAYLLANNLAAYLVLDNCPSAIHRALRKQVSASGKNIHLLTIEYDISDDSPEETEVIHIEPSSVETVSKLVQKRHPELDRVNADKIAEFAGGNARVALALSSRVKADETLSNFSDEDLFQRLFSQRKGAAHDLLESAEVLSLVYSFNVSPSAFNDELSVLGDISGIDRRTLHRHHAELMRRQLAQKRGDWRAVLPQALGNRLAKRALQNISLNDINAQLLKPENHRLFRSCAHRLGYLHDVEPARQLAESWIARDGPLHDIAACDRELIGVLDYIAPVFPGTVLNLIESAAGTAQFASRNNPNFNLFVRLLCHLAYDDDSFDRAAAILLKFAASEAHEEKHNSIVGRFSHLFSLQLSGTHATPARRQDFVENLIRSGKPRHREIAGELLHFAFEASRWTSFADFNFGARQRDYGWQPKTNGESQAWYVGFMRLLEPCLNAADIPTQSWAKYILARHFRSLWSYAGCFDALESVIGQHGSSGQWPAMWSAIKKTLSFDGERSTPEILTRLQALETLTAPADPYQEIEAYALSNTWDHIQGGNYQVESEAFRQHVEALGAIAARDPHYIERLGEKLWLKHFDALFVFGRGLAKGSADQATTFARLVKTVRSLQSASIHPIVLQGYFEGVSETNEKAAQAMQEQVLDIAALKPHLIYLLTAYPIQPWGVQKLKDLATGGELEAWRFEQLKFGRVHEPIADPDLCDILRSLNRLEKGLLSTLEILSMRFFIDAHSKYKPSEELCGVGRDALLGLLSMHRNSYNNNNISHGLDRVIEVCLSTSAPKSEVDQIVRALCDGIAAFRIYNYDFANLGNHLIAKFPEIILENVFTGTASERSLVSLIFRDRAGLEEPTLNSAPVERLLQWCNGDQSRIAQLAGVVDAYVAMEGGVTPMDNPRSVALSPHIKALLDAADDKLSIVNIIFDAIRPNGWSGSLADILEVRSKAVTELLQHSSEDVRDLVKEKLVLLQKSVQMNREREAKEHADREQRFE